MIGVLIRQRLTLLNYTPHNLFPVPMWQKTS